MESARPTKPKRRRRRSRGRQFRPRHKKRLTNETGVIERALRSLCQNDGRLSLENLEEKVGQFDPGLGSLEEIISDFHDDHFRFIDYADGSVFVEAYTQAKICPSYLKNDCEEGDTCQNLHLCGYFATGSCCWFGVNCRKSHEFRSDHNKQVLKKFGIAFLRNQCLKILFRLAWPHFTVPEFCGLYRSQKGCQKPSCRFLHICRNFVMKECTFGSRCKFAHDVYSEASNLRLLKRFNLEYSSDDLIRLIKERNEGYYRPDHEVLESDGEDTGGEETDEESCSSDTYETVAKSKTQSNDVLNFSNPKTMKRQDKKKEVYKHNPHVIIYPEPQTTLPSKHVVVPQLSAKAQTPSNDLLDLHLPQTLTMQAKKTEVRKGNSYVTTKHEQIATVQTTLPSKHNVVIPHLQAKSQKQSNDLLELDFSQTVTLQDMNTEVSKDSPHITTTKNKPKTTVQKTSLSKHAVISQLPAKSQTKSDDLLELDFSQTMTLQDKKTEVRKDSPHVTTTKNKPKATVQKTLLSKHVVIPQLPAKSRTQSDDLLEFDFSPTLTLQDKKVHKGNPHITTKHEPKVTVQTTSPSKDVVMPQPQAKCQTPSKHFSNPTKLEPTRINQKPSASECFEKIPQYLPKSQIQSNCFLDSNNPQTVSLQAKKEEICKDNLRGSCTSGSLCQRHHCDLPYQWQIKSYGIWESVNPSNNNNMEKDYCDMNVNSPVCLAFDTWGCMHVFYDDLYISDPWSSLKRDIRRLEIKGELEFFDSDFIPCWSWYWKDEFGTWIEYAEQNTKQNARSDKESSDFETLYNDYKNRNGSQTVKFKAGNQHYTLNFASMTQTNDRYGTQKDVRRRPSKHITSADVKRYREEKPWLNKNKYPRNWNMNSGKSHLLVRVMKHEDSEEYKKIQKLFQTTLPGVNITKLERVQNETCWDLFSQQKKVMMKKNPSKPVQERLLFHGTTPEKVEDICRDNFDFRLSGTRVGAVYGEGAYFASTSKYSDSYAEADGFNVKKMFVARVLVGSYTTGTRDMRRPPYKDPSDKKKGMYDSCVDSTSNPSIFVVFDNHQVYPEYLITYSTTSANQTSYISSSQPSSYNLYTSPMRSNSNASQISHTSTSQRNSYNPSTSTTSRSAYSSSQTSYSSSNQPSLYNYTPSQTASSTFNQTSTSRPSSSTSSTRNNKSSCVCM